MTGGAATAVQLRSFLNRLEQSQWWPAETLRQAQEAQLRQLLGHAAANVPHYRRLWQGADPSELLARWQELPILSRETIQTEEVQLHSERTLASHGRITTVETSGSTGRPIRALGTGLSQLFGAAILLREHLWHRRDFKGRLIAIRPDRGAGTGQGQSLSDWGPPVNLLFASGPSAVLDSHADVAHQLEWLARQQPSYLLSLPSNIQALAETAQSQGITLPALKEVRTFGETLSAAQRALVREVWGVPITDVYSTCEIGYIALQCPEHEHYHIQAENVLAEILDDAGRPCAPGQVGRLVLTPLQNFAMPLIRYEIQDYVQAGEPCPCGRGLPVIARIMGRERNLAVLPDGRRFWPSFPAEMWMHIGPIRQIQLVQDTPQAIRIRLVAERPLNAAETEAMQQAMRSCLGHPFAFSIEYLDSIPHGRNGKYEDFICKVDSQA